MEAIFTDYQFELLQKSVRLYIDDLSDAGSKYADTLATARSAERKIKHFRKGPPKLTVADGIVLVEALRSLRQKSADFLSEAPLHDQDRPIALKTQRDCGVLIRMFRDRLAAAEAEE